MINRVVPLLAVVLLVLASGCEDDDDVGVGPEDEKQVPIGEAGQIEDQTPEDQPPPMPR